MRSTRQVDKTAEYTEAEQRRGEDGALAKSNGADKPARYWIVLKCIFDIFFSRLFASCVILLRFDILFYCILFAFFISLVRDIKLSDF